METGDRKEDQCVSGHVTLGKNVYTSGHERRGVGRGRKGLTADPGPLLLHNGEMVVTFLQIGESRGRTDFGKERLNRKTDGSLPTFTSRCPLRVWNEART